MAEGFPEFVVSKSKVIPGKHVITVFIFLVADVYLSVYHTNEYQWYGKDKETLFGEFDAKQNGHNKFKSGQTKRILLWNTFFSHKDYFLELGSEGFKKYHCEYSNCYLAYNRSEVPIDTVDAIIFHSPSLPSGKADIKARSPHQRYVFYSLESPDKFPPNYGYTVYNWTASYRQNADIPVPYGDSQPKIESDEVPVTNSSIFDRKSKWVAWFVSNCKTGGQRDKYVKALQQYIPVDIYGKCGNKTCKRGETECDDILEKDYKFYLSFENAICTDYVTEKLFKTMQYNVVPVVYGGADYANILPPKSFLNAMDYKPKALAEELYRIGNNSLLYMNYLAWKKNYQVNLYTDADHGKSLFCNLCKKLHEDKVEKHYSHLKQTWTDGVCKQPNVSLFS